MQQKNIRRLVIVDKDRMVGIITDRDIFRAIMNNQDHIPEDRELYKRNQCVV